MSPSSPTKPTLRVGHSVPPNRGLLTAFGDAIRGRHASQDEGPECRGSITPWRNRGKSRKSFKQQFLHPDYFYNHAEPHRRRPTLVTFPHFITHTATFFSGAKEPQTAFRKWLKMFEVDAWQRRPVRYHQGKVVPWAVVLNLFSQIAQPSFGEEKRRRRRLFSAPAGLQAPTPSAQDVEFFIELIHRKYPEIVARIEAHSEFFTLTLFKPLSGKFNLATVYEEYGPQLVPEGKPDCSNPFHALYAGLVKRFPGSTFAHFKGVVVGPKAFHPEKPYPAAPAFPRPGDSGPMDPDVAASTAMFLRGQKEAFKKGLFAASDEDVVACYFQRGQVIYVSALGAQRDTNSMDELRYLLIYNEAPIKRGMRLGLARWRKPGGAYNANADRHRLSRLVHRVNTIGTLRLAALRDLRRLRRAGDELRRIETGIEIAAQDEAPRSRVRKLGGMIGRLENMARTFAFKGTPLFYRTARASLYFDQMKKLLEDLGVDPIPEWQSYNQFLSRRLFAQHEFTATLGNRISELGALARSHAEVAEAQSLRWLEWAARMASLILLPLAVADVLRDRTSLPSIVYAGTDWLASVGFEVEPILSKVWNWVPKNVQSWWRARPDYQEFWLVYEFTFFIWLALILLQLWLFRRSRNQC